MADEPRPLSDIDATEPPRDLPVDVDDGEALCVVHSPHLHQVGRLFLLTRDGVSIGSSEGNHIVIRDANVAAVHALMVRDRRGWRVLDTGTPLGTYRNGIPVIAETALRDGDHLQVGQTVLALRASAGEAPPRERGSAADERARGRSSSAPAMAARREIDALLRAFRQGTLPFFAHAPALPEPLPGPRLLRETLEREILRARRWERPLSLVLLAIDGLDEVEAMRGRGVRIVAFQRAQERLNEALAPDEKAVALPDHRIAVTLASAGPERAARRGEELKRALDEHPFAIDGRRLPLSTRVAVATLCAEDRGTDDIVVRAADALGEPPAKRAVG